MKVCSLRALLVFLACSVSGVSQAALVDGSVLEIGTGSSLTLSVAPGYQLAGAVLGQATLSGHDGLIVGTAQAASGSHSGFPNGTESPGIDQPWALHFTGVGPYSGSGVGTGLEFTSLPTSILMAGANSAYLDFSGWGFKWNGDTFPTFLPVPLRYGNGPATVVCSVDCSVGDSYTLTFDAKGMNQFWGATDAHLVLTGTITAPAAVPVPAAAWLFGSGLLGLVGVARKRKAA